MLFFLIRFVVLNSKNFIAGATAVCCLSKIVKKGYIKFFEVQCLKTKELDFVEHWRQASFFGFFYIGIGALVAVVSY